MSEKLEKLDEAAILQTCFPVSSAYVGTGMNLIPHPLDLFPQSQITGYLYFLDLPSNRRPSRVGGHLNMSHIKKILVLPVEKTPNGKQQNAYRRIPPGRNPGCGAARQPN
jgi:hypothetical protein